MCLLGSLLLFSYSPKPRTPLLCSTFPPLYSNQLMTIGFLPRTSNYSISLNYPFPPVIVPSRCLSLQYCSSLLNLSSIPLTASIQYMATQIIFLEYIFSDRNPQSQTPKSDIEGPLPLKNSKGIFRFTSMTSILYRIYIATPFHSAECPMLFHYSVTLPSSF